MKLFSQFLGKKQETEVQPGNTERNASYEEQLRKDFGVQCGDKGWAFYGSIKDFTDLLNDPDITFGTLKEIQKSAHFTKVFIGPSGGQWMFIINLPVSDHEMKPCCLISSLNAGQVGTLMVQAIMKGGNTSIEYRGTWVLSLS